MKKCNDTIRASRSAQLPGVIALFLFLVLGIPTSGRATSLPACRFTPGERLIYRILLTGDATARLNSLQQEGQRPSDIGSRRIPSPDFHLRVEVAGDLVMTILERRTSPGSTLAVYRLREPVVRLIINNQEVANQESAIRNELDSDILVDVDCQGRIISARFDPGVTNSGDLSKRFARALLAATQFVFSDDGSMETAARRSWQMKESDPFGFYMALYQAAPGHAKSVLKTYRKTKLRYLPSTEVNQTAEQEARPRIMPKGSLSARFDIRTNQLRSLNGSERQTTYILDQQVSVATETFAMELLRSETAEAAELIKLRRASETRAEIGRAHLFETRAREESEVAIHRVELGGATLQSLLADLVTAEANPAPDYNDTSLFLKLKALAFLQPAASVALGETLIRAGPTSRTTRLLTDALSSAGHGQAQAALVAAIQAHSTDWPALARFVPALGTVSSPTQDSEDALRELAFHSPDRKIATTAQLALGSMAGKLVKIDATRANRLVDRIVEKIESCENDADRRQFLLVLGNVGSKRAFPVIIRYLTRDSAPVLRAAAVSALRFVPGEDVDSFLAKALLSDPEISVRIEAVFAFGFRPANSVTYRAQKQALSADTSAHVRLGILRNFWKARGLFPEIMKLVKHAATKDASPDVRKAAKTLLPGGSKSP